MNHEIVTIAFDTLTQEIKRIQMDVNRNAYTRTEVIDMIAKLRANFMQKVNRINLDSQ